MYWHGLSITAFTVAALSVPLWTSPASAQITGPGCAALPDSRARLECMARNRPPPRSAAEITRPGCNGLADLRARMECLGRAQTSGTPPGLLARPAPQRCNFAAPCTDSRGRYYLSDRGQKVYFPRR